MRLLVCGGRDYTNKKLIETILNSLDGDPCCPNLLIHGAAQGADSLAAGVAFDIGWNVKAFPADWTKHGKSAGPIRNAQMLKEGTPDLVIAFPGGYGTKNMMEQATKAGIPVLRVVDPLIKCTYET